MRRFGGRRQKFSASSQNIVDRYFYLNWNSKYFRRTKVHYLLWNYWNIPMIVIKKIYFLFMSYMYIPMVVPNHSRVSRRHQLLSLNPLSLSNSRSSATAQKPVNFISHICGLGASVGCERVERTFNTPRLKAQICLIEGNGFVCSLLNELNSKSCSLIKE